MKKEPRKFNLKKKEKSQSQILQDQSADVCASYNEYLLSYGK